MSPTNNYSCISSFSIWMPFISSSLIAVARASNIMLNKRDENEQSCLVPDLKENVFSSSPLTIMLTVGLSYMACIRLSCVSST